MAKTRTLEKAGTADPAPVNGSTAAVPATVSPARARHGVAEQAGEVVAGSVRAARSVLPAGRLPVVLAAAALLVTGLVEPPVALGLGLAYEALRRWEPTPAAT